MENRRFYGPHRSIFMVLFLAFITCGIYSFFWMYQVTKELNEYTGDHRTNPSLVIVFVFLTFGLYMFYWWYRINQLMMEAQFKTGYNVISDNKLLFLLFTVFGVSFINMAILQSDLNTLWERASLMEVVEEPMEETYQSQETVDDEWTDY
ncbi:DUF4234 domain-containing protein [Enterococcus olivae]